MIIKQVSIFVENETGRLYDLMQTLADEGVNLNAATIAETGEYGILRCIVQEPEKVVDILRAHNYSASLTEVIAVAIDNKPGGLNSVLKALAENDIAVKYIYSTIQDAKGEAAIMVKVSDSEKAVKILENAGVKLFSLADLA
ncbi:MAG: amino acid-binding protein [Clostridiales bacterium]|nr:amino acid-binding protein [Clostridiales bacterium]MDD7035963.1 hypothetical protein [Bacillota bacterium]MDY2920481.1 amino acid-binding protein [Lentihominibacter sp.]